jgi:hypothetical protein
LLAVCGLYHHEVVRFAGPFRRLPSVSHASAPARSNLAKAPKKPEAPPATAAADADHRISPDPFAAVLPGLAALGAIASIAAINWVGQERTPDRAKARRKAGAALRDLETCCLGLAEIFRRFQRNPRLFVGEGGQGSSPMKFGVHGPRASLDDCRLYQQLVNDVASMLVLASQNAFDVMCAVEDGEIAAPEDIFYGFGAEQERLNKLIQERATLKVTVDTCAAVAETLTGLVRALKSHRVD